jgi:hypothetical protein
MKILTKEDAVLVLTRKVKISSEYSEYAASYKHLEYDPRNELNKLYELAYWIGGGSLIRRNYQYLDNAIAAYNSVEI